MNKKKMKFFEAVQANHAIFGIISNRTRQSNKRISATLVLHGSTWLSLAIFIHYEANNFVEYVITTFLMTGLTTVDIVYMVVILKMAKLFSFIDNLENVLHQSMCIYLNWMCLTLIVCRNVFYRINITFDSNL